MSDVKETEGGMQVICETIDQLVDVLVEHRRRSSDTLSRRGEVPIKIIIFFFRGPARSGCWLGWRIQCIVFYTSFGRFEESTVIMNDRLAFLVRFLSLLTCLMHLP